MDTVTYEPVTTQCPLHTIACDDCGKVLAKSLEEDDGYYERPGGMKYNIYLDRWYSVNKTLCDECWKKYKTKLINTLHDLDFTEGL